MTHCLRTALLTLALVACSACDAEPRSWTSAEIPLSTTSEAVVITAALAPPSGLFVSNPVSPVNAPNRVTVFVGDELVLDLELLDPIANDLLATQLPSSAAFTPDPDGAEVRWSPTLGDVGTHNFIFEVVDSATGDFQVALVVIEISVFPRLSLVEYGF